MAVVPVDLEAQAAVVAGHLNVQHARAAALVAEVIAGDEWRQRGIHSPEHWARLHLGLNAAQARTLCNVARRWSEFPDTMTEFSSGGLSLAQVDAIVAAAPEWADTRLAKFAPGLSVTQLRNTIRDEFFEHDPAPEPGASRPTEPSQTERVPTPDAHRDPTEIVAAEAPDHFGYEWRSGRLVVHGEFAADRGTAIEALLEHLRDELFDLTGKPVSGAEAFAELVARAGRAPAGANLSDEWGNGSRLGDVLGRVRTYLHLEVGDAGTRLAGHLSNGVRLPQAILEYLTCDGGLTPVWEHDHTPVGYGRTARIVPTDLRRLIQRRDGGCRVPGCGNPHTEAHHLAHWTRDHGPTETWNVASLCPRHHRMHHQGLLQIDGNPDRPDGLTFTDSTGRTIAATIPIKPFDDPSPPAKPFEQATAERFSLRQFYGWTEAGCRTSKRYAEFRAAQPPHPDNDDDPSTN